MCPFVARLLLAQITARQMWITARNQALLARRPFSPL